MKFDFDKIIDRSGTSSLKWDHYGGRDVIPMWVADMDFTAPPAVSKALHERIDHGVFGYTLPPGELVDVTVAHVKDAFGWQIEPGWIVWLPGLVTGINVACRAVGQSGDEVVTFTPAYPPFLSAPNLSDRKGVNLPLKLIEGKYQIDLAELERKITPRTCLLNLCSPHNPSGRVWERTELEAVAEICLKNETVICSDEIHNELILEDVTHVPTASLSDEIARNTITLMAPSKTFNIAGLGCSFAVIPSKKLRKKFFATKQDIVPYVNLLGYTACLAAYRDGSEWHDQLLAYLKKNRDLVYEFVNDEIPGLSTTHVQATYLAWIDATSLPVDDPARFFAENGTGLSDGSEFGSPGFVRLNFGCPRAILIEGLQRMKSAVLKLMS